MSVNKAILVGRLGNDPEIKQLPNGGEVCNFSLATSESWTDKTGSKQERTEWHRVTAFGKLASVCAQYLGKGSEAYIEGKIATRSWEKNGEKRYATEINAFTVQFIGGKKECDTQKQSAGEEFGGSDLDGITFMRSELEWI